MKTLKKLLTLTMTIILTLSLFGCGAKNKNTESANLTISAAASLKEVMAEIETEFKKEYPNINLTFTYGSSGSLQKQIEQGAPSDLFISAGESQMNALSEKGLLIDDSVKTLVKNNLVLITTSSDITSINDLTTDKVTHIAVGEPSSVPAGKYADQSLTNLSLKDAVSSKLVYAKDVKEVLSWTVSGNADAGFVYQSDTYNNNSINVIETISEDYHSPITYPAAIIKSTQSPDAAKSFEDFLFTDKAKKLFTKYGYEPL